MGGWASVLHMDFVRRSVWSVGIDEDAIASPSALGVVIYIYIVHLYQNLEYIHT